MEQLLKDYKILPDNIKNNFTNLSCFKACYDRDENISDDMVILITSLARECWLDDEYSKANAEDYAIYLLDAVYEYNATKEQIENLDSLDVVEKYNNDYNAEEILKLDTSDMQYLFSTTDGNQYYATDDGLYVTNEKGIKIKEPHPMEDPKEEIFTLLKENKISYMPLSTHYDIRCMIKNDILGDKELEEMYKDGIENYKKYCKERFITSKDILRVVGQDTDIDISDDDRLYTDKTKLSKIEFIINKFPEKDISKYSYVASLDNGTDYYFCNNKYIAIDNNYVSKEFENQDLFLFNELKGKHKFAYLSENESKKIADSLTKEFNSSNKGLLKNISDLRNYLKYDNDKELNSFTDNFVMLSLTMAISTADQYSENIKKNLKEKKMESESQKSDELDL